MGFFGMFFGTIRDVKKLGKLTEGLEPEIKALQAAGTCPEDLQQAFNAVANPKEGISSAELTKELENFVDVLQKHSDLFTSDVSAILPEFKKIAEDLEKVAEEMEKQTEDEDE